MSENLEPVLRALAVEQAKTATALEALVREVRTGFERGSKRLDAHEERLDTLESQRDTAKAWARAAVVLAAFLGLDKLAGYLARFF